MLDQEEKARRRRAEKLAYAINSIEGVLVSEDTKQLADKWVNGEISLEQIRQELIRKYKVETTSNYEKYHTDEYKPTPHEYTED
jgi:hypothetical protein